MLLDKYSITTEQLALASCCKANTVRTRLCKTGSFYGIKPVKLPSGRLLWPAQEVQAFLTGKEV